MADHGARPTWLGYIAVEDVDASVEEIEARGGRVLMPAMDIPMVGRIAMVADPHGVPFYVMKPQGTGKRLAFTDDYTRSAVQKYVLQTLMRISYAILCLKKKKIYNT